MATVSTHTAMTQAAQLNLGYSMPFKINVKFIVNSATLLFWDDGKAGFKYRKTLLKTKLRGLSPHANYTDRAAAAGRRS